MKKYLVLLLVLLPALMFAGAQGEEDQAANLTVWTGFPETESTLKNAAEIFMVDNPNVTVEILTLDFSDLQDKALVSIPAGNAADIVNQEMTDMFGFAKAGLLAEAPADIARWIRKSGRYVKSALPIISVADDIYAMPLQTGGAAMFYNKDHLKEAGLSGPPETVQDVSDYAVKLRKKNASGDLDRAGISFRLTGPGGGTQKFWFIAYQFSGKQVITPGSEAGMYHSTAADDGHAEALMWNVNLLNGADKSDDWALQHDADGFAVGDASMFLRESWVVPYLKDIAPDLNYGVSLQPKGKHWGVIDYVAGLTVPNSGKNVDLAWKFTVAAQDEAVMKQLLKESGWIPPRRDINYEDIFAMEPNYRAFVEHPKELITYFEPSLTSSHEIWVSAGEIIQEAFRDGNLVNNLAGCQAIMDKVDEKVNQILKENNEFGN